jgi:hypothetical protein
MAKIQDTAQHVVVYDPKNEFWEGGVVTSIRAAQLRERGVVTLPVIPDLFRASGVGGYAKRSWGGGLPLDARVPTMVAPLTLYCTPEFRGLTWRARLVPEHDGPYDGMVRFASDSGQRSPLRGSYSALDDRFTTLRDLPQADAEGGWVVGGEGVVGVGSEGHYGYSLYACAPGLRVVWVAASLAPAVA